MLGKYMISPSPPLILESRIVRSSQFSFVRNSSSPLRNGNFNFAAKAQHPDQETETWEACKQALSCYGLEREEQEKVIGKAFGLIHSPYWGEERKKQAPDLDSVAQILSYLKGIGLSDDDVGKILKKFPEVLGCNLDDEVKGNVEILEKEWGIQGKSLRNVVVRNPRVLGYKIDCKGDCKALCTRCWARF